MLVSQIKHSRRYIMPKGGYKPLHKLRIWRFILLNLLIALAIGFIFCPECFSSIEGLKKSWGSILYSFVLSSVLSGGISRLEEYMGARVSWIETPGKRFFLEVIMITAYSSIASFIVIFLFHWAFGHFQLDNIPWKFIFNNVKYPVYIAYIITAFFMSRAFLFEWKQAAVDAEKLRAEQFAGKYRMLKDQLNPHFLFNSLNVLSNIVYEDQDKAADFIQQLSRFYRYVLEVQKEEIVPLEKELDFGRRYLKLQQLRFGDNLKVDWTAEAASTSHIPPLSLQLLLENAIKHNEVSNNKPLKLTVETKDSFLIVENEINEKVIDDGTGTGVGLSNIQERYRLLSGREVNIINDGRIFRVELPILNLEN